jgi:predicted outer membrane lipoprotein
MRKQAFWLAGVALVGAIGIVLALWTELIEDQRDLGVALAAVAAVGGLGAMAIGWMSTRVLEELRDNQRQTADDVRRLAELTESSLEEARAQKPEPVVRFVVEKERLSAKGAIVTRKRFAREIQVQEIVAFERSAALATLPSEEPPTTAPKPRQTGLAAVLATALAGLEPGPITAEERESFKRRVENYASELREWLRDYERYRREADPIIALLLRFENIGRVPAHGVRVSLQFPDGFTHAELPERPGEPPTRPRFQRKRIGLAGFDPSLLYRDPSAMLRDYRLPTPPVRRNVSAPRYRDGSVIVEFDIEKLRHGIPEDADELIVLTVDSDGEFMVPWEIHAENLALPATGELSLQVGTEPEAGPPIASLAELRAFLEPEEEEPE